MSKKKLYLLDGMALAYRAHFAFINSRLKNSEGIATGPILGFANTLVKLLEEEKPTHIAVVWDTHEPTFRHDIDKDYKANRPPQPEELRSGIPLIKEMIDYFGIHNLEQDGYEADDIIGTIASNANAEDVNVYLVTPDKDFMQLVHDHITMVKPDNKNGGFIIIDREGVKEYFDVYPEQVVDVLALIGDTSDNIPGVPGIGKKGAPDLIKKYGSLENAIKNADKIKSKRQREGLSNYAEQALHAKKMVTIKTDVPETIQWRKLEWQGPDKKELGLFFKRMEFRTLTKKYLGIEPGGQNDLFSETYPEIDDSERNNRGLDSNQVVYKLAKSREDIHAIIEEIKDSEVLCFDTETDASDPIRALLVGISLCTAKGKAWYIPVNLDDTLPATEACSLLEPVFKNRNILKIAHNLKFDYLMLKRAGMEMKGPYFDTMVAAYLLDANQKLKMDFLSKKYLNYEPIPIERLIGSGRNQKTMAEIPYTEIKDYACEDADITLQLYDVLKDKLIADELLEIADRVDFPLTTVLGDVELNGIRIDIEMLEQFSKGLDQDIAILEKKIFEEAGESFNVNSPQQLGQILFEKLDIPSGKKTKTGQYSTAESVLTGLANEHKVPELVL
ncbi:MAG: DNA polymerase, partial [Balneolaceae bacterium]